MSMIDSFIGTLVGMTWNYPVVGLCLFTGLFFTFFKLPFIQLRSFKHALSLISGKYDNPNEKGHITHFQALSAALSATVGLGNIAGVAIAISLGGPGAVFWMWVVGFMGMATKFVECTLGTFYRDEDAKTGEVRGGPMYYITKGLGSKFKPMAIFFAVCAALGAFGAGAMFQSNQAANALFEYYNVPLYTSGLLLAACLGIVVIGGIKRIGEVASKIVPTMCAIYVVGAVLICILNADKMPEVFSIILSDAFTGAAAAGGSLGTVIIMGVRRAVFSNEAGLGSAAIAHAAVKTDYPVREGIVASLGPFIDTILVCTATASIIIMSGLFGSESYKPIEGYSNVLSQPNAIERSAGWDLTDDKPVNKSKLRKFKSDSTAAVFTGSGSGRLEVKNVPIAVRNENDITLLGSGIRFSSYRGEGDYWVSLRDGDTELAKLKVLKKNDMSLSHVDADHIKMASLSSGVKQNEWGSHVITLEDGLISQIKQKGIESLNLVFFVGSGSDAWTVDRIQVVQTRNGITLTVAAFDHFFEGFGTIFVALSVLLFAFSTMITWSYYGETAAKFLFGGKVVNIYRWFFVLAVVIGAVNSLDLVVNFTDLMVGLMVIPNSIAILLLSKKVKEEAKHYFYNLAHGKFKTFK